MSVDPKYGRYCDECGRTILKAHRVFQDNDYCASCYPRVFISKPCTQCGASARVHHLSRQAPFCRSCLNSGRVCMRCEKPVVKAGMISEGKPVCPACVPYFRTPEPCTGCGSMSTRLSAMPSVGIYDKLCDSCRNKITHRTCSVCRKYRKVAGTTADDKPYCEACVPGRETVHSCPDCGVELPGAGEGRCRSCLNRNQLIKEATLHAAAMTHDWMRRHCTGFAEWIWRRHSESPGLTAKYRQHQPMIERLDASFANESDVSAAALLTTFGTATLRRHLLVTQYFQDALNLSISSKEKAEAADLDRIRTKLLESKGTSWSAVLHRYSAWLENESVAIRTWRLYVATAESFCSAACVGDAPWKMEQARKFVRAHPGCIANLSKFFRYCNRVEGWSVAMPKRDDSAKRARVPTTVSSLKKLLRRVSEVGIDEVDRETLCRVMAKSLGLRISAMQAVSISQFEDSVAVLSLSLDDELIVIPSELIPVARAYMQRLKKSVP